MGVILYNQYYFSNVIIIIIIIICLFTFVGQKHKNLESYKKCRKYLQFLITVFIKHRLNLTIASTLVRHIIYFISFKINSKKSYPHTKQINFNQNKRTLHNTLKKNIRRRSSKNFKDLVLHNKNSSLVDSN